MNDLISIVLPVYNGAKFLKESIDSIIAQTYTNWELLILDDCSTDETPEIALEYIKKDGRIKYYRNDVNLRLPNNLNKGFSLAKGDYLTWTSDDNRYRPMALQKMHDALCSEQNIDFVFASCQIIDELGSPIEYILSNPNYQEVIVGSNCVGACFLYTRRVYNKVGEYNHEYILVEDFDYWQRALAHFNARALDEILYDYRWHPNTLTSTMRKEQFNINLEKVLLKNSNLFGKLDFKQKYQLYNSLNACRKSINHKDNPYFIKFKYYSFLHLILCQVPNKIKRKIHKLKDINN